jgi:hypothetical protein
MSHIVYDSANHATQAMRVCICEKTLSDGSHVYDVYIPAQTGTAMSESQATEFARRMHAAQNENTKPLDGLSFQSEGAA